MTVDSDDFVRERTGLGAAGRCLYWFGGKAFKPADFTKAIADLKATRFQRFTDNFIGFNAGGDIRGPWHNPYFYQQYSDAYGGKPPYTMDECVEQVRRRGKEFGQAVVNVYPKITLMFLHQTG